jgi:hypothetical protein
MTVLLYFAAVGLCGWVLRTKSREMAALERWVWRGLAAGLAVLGVNKQLDLQTALTELGRLLAADEGWYDDRRRVQRLFIFGVGLAAVAVGTVLLALARRSPPATSVALVGSCALLAFVVIRASSFHHVDVFIASRWWGLRGNWLVEVGGLLVVLAGAAWRSRAPAPPALPSERPRSPAAAEWLRAPRRRPLFLVVPAVLVAAAALATSLVVPKRYRASALVRVTWDDPAGTRGTNPDLESRRLRAMQEQVLDRAAVERVLLEAGSEATGRGGAPPSAREVEGRFAALSVRPLDVDTLLIEHVAGDPATAARVANRVAELLVAGTARTRAEVERLEARLAEARLRVAAAATPPVGQPAPEPGQSLAGTAVQIDAERRAVEADLSAARDRAERLRSEIDSAGRAAGPDPSASAQLAELRSRRAELRQRYTDQHPDVEALTRRIERLEAASPPPAPAAGELEALQAQLSSVQGEIDSLERRRHALGAELQGLADRARPSGAPGADAEARAKGLEAAQAQLLSVQEEARAARASLPAGSVSRCEIVKPAAGPTRPFFPRPTLFALLGLAVGFVLGAGAAVAAEATRRSGR